MSHSCIVLNSLIALLLLGCAVRSDTAHPRAITYTRPVPVNEVQDELCRVAGGDRV